MSKNRSSNKTTDGGYTTSTLPAGMTLEVLDVDGTTVILKIGFATGGALILKVKNDDEVAPMLLGLEALTPVCKTKRKKLATRSAAADSADGVKGHAKRSDAESDEDVSATSSPPSSDRPVPVPKRLSPAAHQARVLEVEKLAKAKGERLEATDNAEFGQMFSISLLCFIHGKFLERERANDWTSKKLKKMPGINHLIKASRALGNPLMVNIETFDKHILPLALKYKPRGSA
ncbi:hypothetical protein H9P43_006447 [Blastocladiella emersonii ATCC 22665]|nr:hypothetical protein H9P43_006447 [Blastocladiella emersonii ATCC 22665]